jgi:two-component system catabolic regulation response regulator CreB/two-component system response regulator ChvI
MSTARILILDDEPDIGSLMKMILEYDGSFNNVKTFHDPILALSDFKADLYDLVILDLKMPDIDGLDLYREMTKKDNKVKFCFLTGKQSCCDEAIEGYQSLNGDMFKETYFSQRSFKRSKQKAGHVNCNKIAVSNNNIRYAIKGHLSPVNRRSQDVFLEKCDLLEVLLYKLRLKQKFTSMRLVNFCLVTTL